MWWSFSNIEDKKDSKISFYRFAEIIGIVDKPSVLRIVY